MLVYCTTRLPLPILLLKQTGAIRHRSSKIHKIPAIVQLAILRIGFENRLNQETTTSITVSDIRKTIVQ